MNLSIIVSALRSKMRFLSARGMLSIEQLFEVPLRSTSGRAEDFSLDAMSQAQYRAVRDLDSGSFVDRATNKQLQDATLALDILKWVIGIKLEEETAREKAVATRAEEKRILDALAARQAQKLAGASEEELLAQLQKIRAA